MIPIVGIDLGGTQIRAILAEADGTILARHTLPTAPAEGREAVLQRIARATLAVIEQGADAQPLGVGVGSAGAIDPTTGTVHTAPNLGWRDVPLRAILEKRLGLPVVVGNDANAAALAEWRFGAGRGTSHLVYMTVSTGIGAGIISGGRLLLGARGSAGEVGHISVEPHGPRCKCDSVGCLEALASGPAIAQAAVAHLRAGEHSTISALVQGDLAQVTAKVVADAAAGGDALATSVIGRAAFYIGVGVANLIHILEPQLILIGGGVANIGDLLFDAIRATVRERAIPALAAGVRIEPAALGDDAGVLGAIALFMEYGDD